MDCTFRNLLWQFDGLRYRVGTGQDGALDSGVCVQPYRSPRSDYGAVGRMQNGGKGDIRFFAYVECLLKEFDQAELDYHICTRAVLTRKEKRHISANGP